METTKLRNPGIDFLRLIGSLAVVGIHVCNVVYHETEVACALIMSLTSFGVPCFFIISGYFFKIKSGLRGITPLLSYIYISYLCLQFAFLSKIKL